MISRVRNFVFQLIVLLHVSISLAEKSEHEDESFFNKKVLAAVGIYALKNIVTAAGSFAAMACIMKVFRMPPFESKDEESIIPTLSGVTLKNYIGGAPKEINSLIKQIKEEKYNEKCTKFNVPIIKGLLFAGPPGTGKSLLATALAGELGFPIFMPNNLADKYIGETEKNITAVFKAAKKEALRNKNKTAIIFFDEIESIASKRGEWQPGVHCVNTLLREMDKKDKTDHGEKVNVIVLGATNDPSMLDKAVLSRLSTLIQLALPNRVKRMEILRHHLEVSGAPLSKYINYSGLALTCNGMSARDIENVCENARRIAVDDESAENVTMKHIEEAIQDRKKSIQNGTKNFLSKNNQKNSSPSKNSAQKKLLKMPIWFDSSSCPLLPKYMTNNRELEYYTPIYNA